jgi:RND family efflux transporter MFP subunit
MRRTAGWGVAIVLVVAIALLAWRVVGERRAERSGGAPEAARAQPTIELMPEDVAVARTTELTRTVPVSGSVRAVTSAFVKARVASEITRIAVREGEAVQAGQVLVQQDTTEFDWRVRQAEQQALAARAQLEIARRQLANNKALVEQGFISPTALETSVSNEAAAQASLEASLAAVEIARKARADATLAAPISGVVSQRLAQPGERIGVDGRILEIVDLSRLEIEAALAPEDVSALRLGSPAQLRVDGIDGPVSARVARINPAAQAGSRAVLVYLALEPHPALRQGLFARGAISVDARRTLVLPASAVRVDRTQPYVLLLEGGKVVARAVTPGTRGEADGQAAVEIAAGLADGARVLAGTIGAVSEGTAWKPAAAPSAPAPAPAAAASR